MTGTRSGASKFQELSTVISFGQQCGSVTGSAIARGILGLASETSLPVAAPDFLGKPALFWTNATF
jgi:hypothetical protein